MEAHRDLSRRERQIMDVLLARGKATAAEIHAAMPDPPSYSAVRTFLRILEEKGHLRHEEDGAKYVYTPVVSPARARRSAMRHLVKTFFEGSPAKAVAALLSDSKLEAGEIDRLQELVDKAKKNGGIR